ncbi:MAG TPA: HD domain-containing phosphohydrolase [Nitrospira sp.]|nr:HD domain-containing phosphohydrolase [Nitrospira sp.]
MPVTVHTTHPAALKIFAILEKVNTLQPMKHDVEEFMVTQVTRLLDEVLPWQRGHGFRTAQIARRLGAAAGFASEILHHLTLASLLHDVGLLALPEQFTAHSECVDLESYAFIQCHPRVGAQWLEPFAFLKRASVIIAHHHERWDGSGYPYGIRGTFIPIEARVLAIADAFDAITVPGVEDPNLRDAVAHRIVRAAAGTQFDPHLVELCREACTCHFTGSDGCNTSVLGLDD